MKKMAWALAVLAGMVGGTLGAWLFAPAGGGAAKETAFERVMRTGVIRCGYNTWAPFFAKNEKTGKPEGFMVDLMEEIGRHAQLKVEWKAELDWGTIPADLATGKADTFCAAVYANAGRARAMLFGDVIGRQYLEPFVRANDNRFDGSPEEVFNRPGITIVGWEGTPTLVQAQLRFPQAKHLVLSTSEGVSSAYVAVMTGKADVFFTSMADAAGFLKSNPGRLKRLGKKYYLGSQSIAMNAPMGDHDLLSFFNTALGELKNDGTFERLYRKYETVSPGFMEVE